jgi:hypothetical protein
VSSDPVRTRPGHARRAGPSYRVRVARPPEPEVHRITSAGTAHSDDLDARMRRYLISMAIRTACVILAFVVRGPMQWVFGIAAVFLPYVAVLFANAKGSARPSSRVASPHGPMAAGRLEASPETEPGPPAPQPDPAPQGDPRATGPTRV